MDDIVAFAKEYLGVSLTPLQKRFLGAKEVRMLTSHEMYRREKFCELVRVCKDDSTMKVICKEQNDIDKLVAAGVEPSQCILSDELHNGCEVITLSIDASSNVKGA